MEPQLIVVIGLPGSGKSEYSKQYTNRLVFDDFITHFYNGQVVTALLRNKQICINDPRLCNYETFKNIIEKIPYTSIKLILFENNPNQCIKNCELKSIKYKGVLESINILSSVYNLNNYTDYDHQVLPVYTC